MDFFWKHVARRYGKAKIDALAEAIDLRADNEMVDVYPMLYESLDLSVDFLAGYHWSIQKHYLGWFLALDINPPLTILDIACGNGVLTCFYAKIFPESYVYGFDKSSLAIKCATELAHKLNLSNVKFECLDVSSQFSPELAGPFDIITAVTAFREIVLEPDHDKTRSIKSLLNEYEKSVFIEPLNRMSCSLKLNEGIFISVERWFDVYSYAWWACALRNAELAIDFEKSQHLSYKDQSKESHKIPILLSRKKDDLVKQSLEDLLAFWLFSKHHEKFKKFRTFDFQGDLAETAFLHINPKTFKKGIAAEHRDGEGVWRMEIWQAGPFLLVFQHRTDGHRVLEVLPSILYESAKDHIKELADGLRGFCDIRTYMVSEIHWNCENP
jgi:SAM-dependent methyltransferase